MFRDVYMILLIFFQFTQDGEDFEMSTSFMVRQPPYGGSLSADPLIGELLLQIFEYTASSWYVFYALLLLILTPF